MSRTVRPRVESKHVKLTKELVNHPQSTDFNDSLSYLIKDYKRLRSSSNNSLDDSNNDSQNR